MILGLSTSAFTEVHVVMSLLALFSGLLVVVGMLRSRRFEGWTIIFLLSSVLTSSTGLLFPSAGFGPSHVIAAVSLLTLATAITARYGHYLVGAWRWTYVASAVLAIYLDVFISIVRAFEKQPMLRSLAPTRSEPPFIAVQLVVLVVFIAIGWRAAIKFHPRPVKAQRRF